MSASGNEKVVGFKMGSLLPAQAFNPNPQLSFKLNGLGFRGLGFSVFLKFTIEFRV